MKSCVCILQITCRGWKGIQLGKGHDSTSLILKVVATCGDPTLLVVALKSHLWVKGIKTRDCMLKGSKLLASTK